MIMGMKTSVLLVDKSLGYFDGHGGATNYNLVPLTKQAFKCFFHTLKLLNTSSFLSISTVFCYLNWKLLFEMDPYVLNKATSMGV